MRHAHGMLAKCAVPFKAARTISRSIGAATQHRWRCRACSTATGLRTRRLPDVKPPCSTWPLALRASGQFFCREAPARTLLRIWLLPCACEDGVTVVDELPGAVGDRHRAERHQVRDAPHDVAVELG